MFRHGRGAPRGDRLVVEGPPAVGIHQGHLARRADVAVVDLDADGRPEQEAEGVERPCRLTHRDAHQS